MDKDVSRNMSVLREQSSLIVERQSACATYLSCRTVPSKVSGVYLIRIDNATTQFKAFCEQNRLGGRWLVVQHRFDGSVDFYRNWTEYREGFGEVDKEFWLGLEKIHQITTARPHEIIIEMKDFSGVHKFARYDAFKLSGENDQYRLTLGKYRGTAGDSMKVSKGMKFSTKDRDNDLSTDYACAREMEGAWWYKNCANANLNGRYQNTTHRKSMHWYHFQKDFQGMSCSRIMIRELR
ncbi:ficolin-3-like [Anopheles aquasalis]|uniref:ficolin-3-like n=1 Tax=Anopheles aquasalis TaxID=42839 RepID=UPI00215ACEA7|nr:ficolin-3-like [Anopheles aquasalis]